MFVLGSSHSRGNHQLSQRESGAGVGDLGDSEIDCARILRDAEQDFDGCGIRILSQLQHQYEENNLGIIAR